MPLRPKGPWFRKGRGWYTWLNGKQISLGIEDPKQNEQAWDAFYALMKRHRETRTEGPPPPGNPAEVAEVVGLFLDYAKTSNAGSTYDWYARYLRSFSKHVGRLPLDELKPHHVTGWLTARYKDRSHRQPTTAVKRAFHWAVEQGHIEKSPLASVRRQAQRRREGVLTPKQRAAIHKAVGSVAFGQVVTALEQTGARVQEVREVEARHFSAELKAWVFPAAEHKTGKRTNQPRIIPLPDSMVALTKRLAKKHPKGVLFRNCEGFAWTSNALSQQFRRLRKRVKGLPANLCGTHFRHTLATELVTAGTNLDVIRQILGHADFRMLSGHYLHSQDVELLRTAISARAGGPHQDQPKK